MKWIGTILLFFLIIPASGQELGDSLNKVVDRIDIEKNVFHFDSKAGINENGNPYIMTFDYPESYKMGGIPVVSKMYIFYNVRLEQVINILKKGGDDPYNALRYKYGEPKGKLNNGAVWSLKDRVIYYVSQEQTYSVTYESKELYAEMVKEQSKDF